VRSAVERQLNKDISQQMMDSTGQLARPSGKLFLAQEYASGYCTQDLLLAG